jgi:anti-sigma factor RsiW
MECEEAKLGLFALLDNELDVAENLEILSHLQGCPACQRALDLDERLRVLVREQLLTCSPSSALWRKIAQRIKEETEEEMYLRDRLARLWPNARPFRAALAGLAVVGLFILSLFFIHPRETTSVLVDEIAQDHIRSVAKASGPVDFPSSDLAEIAQHFRQKFPVPSKAPAHEGLKLLGGSLCQIDETKGIRLTYELGEDGTVSFYQLERSDLASFASLGSARLYAGKPKRPGIVLWRDNRFVYALVAELPAEDLQRLASRMGGI